MKVLIITLLLALLFIGVAAGLAAPDINNSHCKSDYTPYVLIDNPSARDISYTELLAFLDTFKPEVLPGKTCGHYAEELHNYAESKGVRCAVVTSNYHAFNGFLTGDIMTYVDAGKGIISIAIENDGGLEFVKEKENCIGIQKVGNEKEFQIWWSEGEK